VDQSTVDLSREINAKAVADAILILALIYVRIVAVTVLHVAVLSACLGLAPTFVHTTGVDTGGMVEAELG
jgi:hypothetical protein